MLLRPRRLRTHPMGLLTQRSTPLAVATLVALIAITLAAVPAAASADTTAPVVSIIKGPGATEPAVGTDDSPTFEFAPNEPVAFYECAVTFGHPIDSLPPFGPCSGPGATHTTPSLPDGQYAFLVRAVDLSANLGLPDFRDFWVRQPPSTSITRHPPKKAGSSAKFKFTSDKPGATFRCRLDRRRFRACTSPVTYRKLAAGESHRFKVFAIDELGVPDPSKATFRWKTRG